MMARVTEQYTVGLTEANPITPIEQAIVAHALHLFCLSRSRVSPSSSHWSIVFVQKPPYSLFNRGLFRDDGQTKFNAWRSLMTDPTKSPLLSVESRRRRQHRL